MSEPILLPSGRTLTVNIAPFSVGKKAFKTLARELLLVRLDLDITKIKTVGDLDVNILKDAILQCIASDVLELCFFECAAKCLISDGSAQLKVDKDSFEHEDARQDYLFVVWEVMKDNLIPFFKGLGSVLPTSAKPQGSAPP